MKIPNNNISKKWQELINIEKQKPYFKNIKEKIKEDKRNSIIIYPEEKNIFAAFEKTPIEEIKVFII